MTARSGRSLAELVLVAWLFAFVLAAAARYTVAVGRLAEVQVERARAAEALRTVDLVLGRELRYGAPADVRGMARDSLRVRLARGGGSVCGVDGRSILVRYRGMRLPDPSKDSIRILAVDAPAAAYDVTGAARDPGCGGSFRITLDREPETTGGLALLHETGTYHLSDGALRYRLGRGGRQPLTEELFIDGELRPHPRLPAVPGAVRLLLDPARLPRLGEMAHEIALPSLAPVPESP